jgi:hypothetical protein
MIEIKKKKIHCSCEHDSVGSWFGNFSVLGNIMHDI